MVLVEKNPVVMHASGVTATCRMLAMLADAPVASTDVASLLPVLLRASRHGYWRVRVGSPQHKLQRERTKSLSSLEKP